MGFGQSRSEKRRKNAIHSFREVQVKKNDLRSRSESEMKKLRDREVKFLENLKRTDFDLLERAHYPPQIIKLFMKLGVQFLSLSPFL